MMYRKVYGEVIAEKGVGVAKCTERAACKVQWWKGAGLEGDERHNIYNKTDRQYEVVNSRPLVLDYI